MRHVNGMVTGLVIACLLGCGGGGSGDGGPSNNYAGSFTPDTQSPGANTVYTTGTSGSGSNASLVTVNVIVNDTADIYGASFDVTFDPSKAQFVNYSAGELLEFGGQSVSYQVNATTPGRLVVGVARTSGGLGVTVTDARILIRLTLRVTDAGASAVRFGNPALLNSQNPPTPKSGIAFFGGTLTAT
jgi:hypothetical protein